MKTSKLPNVIALMILTLVTLLIWLTFNVYRSFTSEAPPAVPEEVILPINPRLDTEVIDQMENRLYPQAVAPSVVPTLNPEAISEEEETSLNPQ